MPHFRLPYLEATERAELKQVIIKNIRSEKNHAQKRFKGGLRVDFNSRISASLALKQLTMTTEPNQS
ncbi:hypothetical protein [Helicobacter pylori]|uniref:hypothetical protein n=1 Tax=Helicobacter pylori TaxID=210 RepID=UPI0001E58164|nr:hypothetical protein [Helicobacter pylori]ADO06202.1 hypothetical protein HPSAT_07510 [Helicobacter pylori Sat464]